MAEPPPTSHYFPPGTFQSGASPFLNLFSHPPTQTIPHSGAAAITTFQLPPQNAFSTRFATPQVGTFFPAEVARQQVQNIEEPILEPEDMMLDAGPGFSPSSYDEGDLIEAATKLDQLDDATNQSRNSQDMDVDDQTVSRTRKRKLDAEMIRTYDPLSGVATRIKRLKLPDANDLKSDEPLSIRIIVTTVTGRRIQLVVETNDLVLRIKEQLEQLCSVPASQQRLLIRGDLMADYKELKDYGVKEGSHLFMVLQLVGG